MASSSRVPIRVKPGASRTRVGGEWGNDPPRLVVAVSARAVDGKANAAVVEAMADALGVRRRMVRITAGERNRSKTVEISDPPPGLATTIEGLRST